MDAPLLNFIRQYVYGSVRIQKFDVDDFLIAGIVDF